MQANYTFIPALHQPRVNMKGGGRSVERRALRSLNNKMILGGNAFEGRHADCKPWCGKTRKTRFGMKGSA